MGIQDGHAVSYYLPKASLKIVSSLSVILVSFSSQQNLFPIFSELREKNSDALVRSYGWACAAVVFLYSILGIISIYMFGSAVGEESTVLKNVARECTSDGHCPTVSIILRFMFMLVIACHIPFIFFSGKEGLLIIIDELDRKSVSSALQFKMDGLDEDAGQDTCSPLVDKELCSAFAENDANMVDGHAAKADRNYSAQN